MTRYSQAVARFIDLHNLYCPTITRSPSILSQRVKHVAYFLELLKNPQDKLKVIHVTGTSGKGSVSKLLHDIILAEGKSVGSIISPHTTTFMERFPLNEGLVPANKLTKYIKEVEEVYAEYLKKHPPISFMALCTVLGIYMHAKEGAEWLVMEAGCGGRFDSTNALEKTEAAVITNVDKDHTELLGNTLEEIASRKAGIIKQHGLAIVGEERSKLKKVFTTEAIEKEATLFFARERAPKEAKENADHVNKNMRIAYVTAKELGFSEEAIQKGMEAGIKIPCRFETIQEKPTIILDGAHNPAKVGAFVNLIEKLPKKPIILFGTGAGKDAALMLKKIYPHAKTIHTTRTRMGHKKVANPFTLQKLIPSGKRGEAYVDPNEAYKQIKKSLKKDDIFIIVGSLYLVGELRAHQYPEKEIVKQANSFPI